MIRKLEDVEVRGWTTSGLMREVVEFISNTYGRDDNIDLLLLQKDDKCTVIWRSPGERTLAAKVEFQFNDDYITSKGKYTGSSRFNLYEYSVSDIQVEEDVVNWVSDVVSMEVETVIDRSYRASKSSESLGDMRFRRKFRF